MDMCFTLGLSENCIVLTITKETRGNSSCRFRDQTMSVIGPANMDNGLSTVRFSANLQSVLNNDNNLSLRCNSNTRRREGTMDSRRGRRVVPSFVVVSLS